MRILVADDDELIRAQWQSWAEAEGRSLCLACDGREAVEKAKREKPDVCLLDLKMPRLDGIGALKEIKASLPGTEVIIVTGHTDFETAVAAMKEGAYDYIAKPLSFADAEAAIERALERRLLVEENRYLRRELGREPVYSELIGKSPAMQEVREKVEQAAGSSASVMIRGGSGTGKELVSRLIHYRSARAKGPFVAVNIAALSESLLESELFGHEKNAFTGAAAEKKGRFELADGGTLLLDEISEVPLHQQVKFLRVIQESEIERVGGGSPVKIDVRIISTTNRELERLVEEEKFREDLFYRLNVFTITLPPLRERKEDIPLLANHYLTVYARKENKPVTSVSEKGMQRLLSYSWPGNVRELMHCIESAVIMEQGTGLSAEAIAASKIPETLRKVGMGTGPAALKDVERAHIEGILQSAGGDKTEASRLLGISRSTLYEKIRQYGL